MTATRLFLLSWFISTVALVASAHAGWSYQSVVDEFDGRKTEYISATEGAKSLAVFSDRTGAANFETPSITWVPGASYVCRVDTGPSVDWIVVGKDEKQIAKGTTGGNVGASGVQIFLDDHLYMGKPTDLIKAMFGLDALEVRLRFRDSCGEVHLSKFTLAGFHDAIWELANRNP